MKILLIGPQGSGKSTQAKLLSEYLKLPVVSTGEIFRTMDTARRILEEGRLVDDRTTSEIVKNRLSNPKCQNGFILDGYPRNIEQVKLFDPEVDLTIYLNVSEEEVLERLIKRARADDTQESIKTRLDLYYQQTEPLLSYYKNLGILKEIDGIGEIKEIQQRIRKITDEFSQK